MSASRALLRVYLQPIAPMAETNWGASIRMLLVVMAFASLVSDATGRGCHPFTSSGLCFSVPRPCPSVRCGPPVRGELRGLRTVRCAAAPVLRPIGVPQTLAEDGIVSVPVSETMVDEMQQIFNQLRETAGNQFRRCAPVRGPVSRAGARDNIRWTEEIPSNVEASGFRLAAQEAEVYDVYTTGFAPTMRWVAVGDKATLDRWYNAIGRTIQQQLEDAVGEPIVLCQACFVVVHGGVSEGDAKLHADWAMEAIPRRQVYTALTPLTEFPDDVGGLFLDVSTMPKHAPTDQGTTGWSREKQEVLHRYRRGEAVLFDGKLMHRTQPFANRDFERVLASFSFCSAATLHSSHLPQVVEVLGDQTPAFYVSPQGERGTMPPHHLSFEEARRVVAAAGVHDYHSFWHWARKEGRKLRVPVHPHKDYKDTGWVSWDYFFQR